MLTFTDHGDRTGHYYGCDDEGDEEATAFEVQLPVKYEVCWRCDGAGVHDHPAFSNGITSSEWVEWDDDEQQAYMNGRYDVQCEECKGLRVVQVVDEEKIPEEYKEAWAQRAKEEQEYRNEIAYERRCRERGIEY